MTAHRSCRTDAVVFLVSLVALSVLATPANAQTFDAQILIPAIGVETSIVYAPIVYPT